MVGAKIRLMPITTHTPETAPTSTGFLSSFKHPKAQLPPAGPAWYGSVMGSGIVSTLLMLHGYTAGAVTFMLIGWVLLLGLTAGLIKNMLTRAGFMHKLLTDPASFTAWGMFAMGFLASGTPFATVLPAVLPSYTNLGWGLSWAMWIIGTILGTLTAFGFIFMAVRQHIGAPLPAWCLPVVPVTISATTGAALAGHASDHTLRATMIVASFAALTMALTASIGIIIAIYHNIWFRQQLPHPLATTSFIPLGIVGQSGAAAQAIKTQALTITTPETHQAITNLATSYGIIVTIIGTPLFLWAMYTSYRAFARGLPFTPTWWALTFPVGVCSLGAYNMGWQALSAILLIILIVHWLLAAAGTLATIRQQGKA